MKYLIVLLFCVGFVCAQSKVKDDCKKWPKSDKITSTVLLGFENVEKNEKQWLCTGTLINDKFILTASYCVRHREFGLSKFIKFHDGHIINIKKTVVHPESSLRKSSKNIGLVELEEPVNVAQYMPSCMETDKDLSYDKKWFLNSVNLENAISKFDAEFVSFEDCQTAYPQSKRLEFKNESQLCVIEKTVERLQLGAPLFSGENKLIGVPSFGKQLVETPQVYSKVAFFVPWIESVAWI